MRRNASLFLCSLPFLPSSILLCSQESVQTIAKVSEFLQVYKYSLQLNAQLEEVRRNHEYLYWERKSAIVFQIYSMYYEIDQDIRRRIRSEYKLWVEDFHLENIEQAHTVAKYHLEPEFLKKKLGINPNTVALFFLVFSDGSFVFLLFIQAIPSIKDVMTRYEEIRAQPLSISDMVKQPVCVCVIIVSFSLPSFCITEQPGVAQPNVGSHQHTIG